MLNELELEKSIFEKYSNNFNTNDKLLKLSDQAIKDLNERSLKTEDLEYFEGIALILFGRCRKQFRAVQVLCKKGYGEDAGLILRSMTNALIDISYIKTDPIKLSERYLRYDFVIRKRKLDIMREIDPDFAKDQPSREKEVLKEETILEEVEKFKHDYLSSNSLDWSGKSIEQKAKLGGNSMMLIYDTSYRYYSDFEHNNIMALNSHFHEEQKGQFVILCEPSEENIYLALFDSFNIFIRLFEAFCDSLKLNYKKQIEEIIKEFELIYKN